MSSTAATIELVKLVSAYKNIFPIWTFPFLPFAIAAIFQSVAWVAGPIFFHKLSLIPRIFVLWIIAGLEYTFMSPTMNAGVEVLGMSEPFLVVMYQVMTLVVFIIMDIFVFKRPFAPKYFICFMLLALAVYIAYLW